MYIHLEYKLCLAAVPRGPLEHEGGLQGQVLVGVLQARNSIQASNEIEGRTLLTFVCNIGRWPLTQLTNW